MTRSVLDFPVEVVGVRRMSPTFMRVTLGGESLRGFADGGPSGNRDRRVSLVIPADGAPVPELRLATAPEGWYQAWRAVDPQVRGWMRTYTVRRSRLGADASGPEIDIDFVLHGDGAGHCGPATAWAGRARIGDRIVVIGPNADHDDQAGITWRPGAARRVLLAGDETSVPAISAILESLPAGFTGQAIVEVPCLDDVPDVRSESQVELTWLARDGARHGDRLVEAVHAAIQLASPGEDFYGWVAGEASMVRELRRYLLRGCGIDRRALALMGYWRRGKAEDA